MATTTDDELELEEEKKKPIGKPIVGPVPYPSEVTGGYPAPIPIPERPIGKPILPPQPTEAPVSDTNILPGVQPQTPTNAAPPEMPLSAAGLTTSPDTVSGMGPLTQPQPVKPQGPQDIASKRLSDLIAQGPPKHTFKDTLTAATGIGKGVSGLSGYDADVKRAQEAIGAASLPEQEAAKMRQVGALTGKTEAETAADVAGSELVDVTLGDGTHTKVMRKNLASPVASSITGASRENVAGTNAASRQNVAETNVGGREDVANINAGAKAAPTKTIMEGNKPHVMGWNPDTKKYDRDMGEAPPSGQGSAYANTRTVNLMDPETGLPTVFQYDPDTKTYSKQVGTSATGAYGHEMAQAGAVERAGAGLIEDINKHRNDLGTISAWVQKYGLNTPIANPELANLQAELTTFAALQPAMHGFRARSALEAFNNVIGGLQQDPDATIAAIQGILKTAGYINPTKGEPKSPKGATGGGTGSTPTIIHYDSQGNRVK